MIARRFGIILIALALLPQIVLSVLPAVAASRGGGSAGNGVTVSAAKNGIHLILELPASTYPKNALVLARLRLTNLSDRTVQLWDCPAESLGAVVTSGGAEVYPPLLVPPGAPYSVCSGEPAMGGPHHSTVIPSGTTLTRLTYIVLRAFTVHGFASLAISATGTRPTVIQTPSVHLVETPAAGPSVRISSRQQSYALVTPVKGAGPIVYSQFISCIEKFGNTQLWDASATFSRWTRAPNANQVRAPCNGVEEWVLYVGQPGLPIAQAYYCRQRDRCAYPPPTAHDIALASCKRDIGQAIVSGKLPRLAARYAIGLSAQLPSGLTPAQRALAQSFHTRCAPLLKPKS
jgi:hypothetical protein